MTSMKHTTLRSSISTALALLGLELLIAPPAQGAGNDHLKNEVAKGQEKVAELTRKVTEKEAEATANKEAAQTLRFRNALAEILSQKIDAISASFRACDETFLEEKGHRLRLSLTRTSYQEALAGFEERGLTTFDSQVASALLSVRPEDIYVVVGRTRDNLMALATQFERSARTHRARIHEASLCYGNIRGSFANPIRVCEKLGADGGDACALVTKIVATADGYLSALHAQNVVVMESQKTVASALHERIRTARRAAGGVVAQSVAADMRAIINDMRLHAEADQYARAINERISAERPLIDAFGRKGAYFHYYRRLMALERLAKESRDKMPSMAETARPLVFQAILNLEGEIYAARECYKGESLEAFQKKLLAHLDKLEGQLPRLIERGLADEAYAARVRKQFTLLRERQAEIIGREAKEERSIDVERLHFENDLMDYVAKVEESMRARNAQGQSGGVQ